MFCHSLIRLHGFVNNRFPQDPNRCVYVKQPLDPHEHILGNENNDVM